MNSRAIVAAVSTVAALPAAPFAATPPAAGDRQVTEWQTLHRVTATERVTYVYHGHLYQLVVVSTRALPSVRIATAMYEHAISTRFEIRTTDDGTLTLFSMTFTAEGALAETLLAASYRPRWWLEVQLAVDDTTPRPVVVGGLNP